MATPEELEIIYKPHRGALFPEATASYVLEIPTTDCFGAGSELAEDLNQVVVTLDLVAYAIRNMEVSRHNAAYHLSKLLNFSQKHPEKLSELSPEIRQRVQTAVELLAPPK